MSKSKLQNIKAIKQLVAGEHRMQNRTSIFTGQSLSAESKKHHEVGDIWHEHNPVTDTWITWVQREGWRMKLRGKWDSLQQYEQYRKSFEIDFFPKCDTSNPTCAKSKPSQLDYKIARKTAKCLDCTQKEEAKYKYRGGDAYRKWVQQKMTANAEAYLADQEKQLHQQIALLEKQEYGVNAQGRVIDTFTINREEVEALKNKLLYEFDQYKKWVLGQQEEE